MTGFLFVVASVLGICGLWFWYLACKALDAQEPRHPARSGVRSSLPRGRTPRLRSPLARAMRAQRARRREAQRQCSPFVKNGHLR